MKPAQLSQLMAAPLASIFLILSLCAFRIKPQHTSGEQIFLTHSIREYSGFNDCEDNHRIVVRLETNHNFSINGYRSPLARLPTVLSQVLQYSQNSYIWLLSDADVSMTEFANSLNAIHSASSTAHIFLMTTRELTEYFKPTRDLFYIGVTHPERFTHPPSICVFPRNW
jgi:biopolymer transport protein ExbD